MADLMATSPSPLLFGGLAASTNSCLGQAFGIQELAAGAEMIVCEGPTHCEGLPQMYLAEGWANQVGGMFSGCASRVACMTHTL